MTFWARGPKSKTKKPRNVEQRLDDIEAILLKMHARLSGDRDGPHLPARVARLRKVLSTARNMVRPLAKRKLEAAARRGLTASSSTEGTVLESASPIHTDFLSRQTDVEEDCLALDGPSWYWERREGNALGRFTGLYEHDCVKWLGVDDDTSYTFFV
jgi:hypothetical protein